MVDSPLRAREGLFVLHLFYDWDRTVWGRLSPKEKEVACARLGERLKDFRSGEQCQVVSLACIGRADVGWILLSPELHSLQQLEKDLERIPGPGVLRPVYAFFSMTERSEYLPTEEEVVQGLANRGIPPGSSQWESELAEARQRQKYLTEMRLYPTLPDWPFVSFYPMRKKRVPGANWYALSFEERRKLMQGHGSIGRKYQGKVLQMVTGATGFEEWEWGVTLFSQDPAEIKSIVYEMRFDPVSAWYGEFGPFFCGLQLPLPDLWVRLGLLG
ncbi:chlorite dismutase family protein [Candidatus Methylacidithermus pantelleriae]|uniref:Heme peroxidase n=1 Tax=Candidatus Methylacidithermus pantelleriae TaxID=2744239 RepID=A0A8J2FWT8_9BACT|nr:chlorite dismutase family protein [Candidatus Methylacidithermus pantelleriae]CAF0701029.1 Heme peroxidase [Candidatus Methylacidithermus pantelleriae]